MQYYQIVPWYQSRDYVGWIFLTPPRLNRTPSSSCRKMSWRACYLASPSGETRRKQAGDDFFNFTAAAGFSSCLAAPRACLGISIQLLNSQVATSSTVARTFGGTNDLFTTVLDYKVPFAGSEIPPVPHESVFQPVWLTLCNPYTFDCWFLEAEST